MVSASVVAFDVRPGNPDGVANFGDLAKEGMEVLTPDPASSGGARWNIVAAYLYAAGLPPIVNAVILLVLVALVFVRIGYVYPSRTPVLLGLTVVLGGVWALMILTIILMLPNAPRALVVASLFYPIYYAALSFVLQARRSRARRLELR